MSIGIVQAVQGPSVTEGHISSGPYWDTTAGGSSNQSPEGSRMETLSIHNYEATVLPAIKFIWLQPHVANEHKPELPLEFR